MVIVIRWAKVLKFDVKGSVMQDLGKEMAHEDILNVGQLLKSQIAAVAIGYIPKKMLLRSGRYG
ncbi:hypothetical protein BWQ96_10108 [Gracilariopsis chorda]|uniref:Uncharacterized protein n=1 Tax=Gracilariopsis chorda TaxID=448386 RepID=A0A2V3IDM0_9FLOR|nr:hypothetical protein BWQ96_10108 [Gracilariopsis chorda]|eukprot:PXF40185.1 hypothetical protein BWQ96_10108 [Gracilariopsis chorda]